MVEFETPTDVDTFFREGRIHFNEDYVKKMVTLSSYFGRIPVSQWPMHTGTEQQGFRFGRGFYDTCCPFKKIVSDRCDQNSCDIEVTKVRRPGNSTYIWELGNRRFETDWICVEDLMHRLFPLEEAKQFVNTLASITKSIGEEFAKSYYIGGAGNKWAATIDGDTALSCLIDSNAWFLEEHSGDNELGYNPCYVRVKVDPTELANISMLTLDMLDESLISMQNEDESYRLDLHAAAGLPVLDVIVPDVRVTNILYAMAKEMNSNLDSVAGYSDRASMLKLGIHKVLSNYAFSYDIDAPRYNADSVFNAALIAQQGYVFDADDAETWPRLVRVPRYVEEADELGYSYVVNPDYAKADFGISVIYHPNAIRKWVRPAYTGTGRLQEATFQPNHMMDWEWRRPDWPENRYGELGFFQAQFKWGMQIKDPTIMHCILHRLPKTLRLRKECCALNDAYVPPEKIDSYVCQGLGGSSS